MNRRNRLFVGSLTALVTVFCLAVMVTVCSAAPPRVKASLPFAVTSSGQSLDAETISLVCKRAKLSHTFNNVLKASDLRGIKTIVIAMGGSAKGLGEAGIDENGEVQRVNSVLAAAKRMKIKVIAVHVGGESRKGALSDKFIDPVIAKADLLILTKDSNKDGSLAGIAKANRVPVQVVNRSADIGGELKAIFGVR